MGTDRANAANPTRAASRSRLTSGDVAAFVAWICEVLTPTALAVSVEAGPNSDRCLGCRWRGSDGLCSYVSGGRSAESSPLDRTRTMEGDGP